MNKHAGRYKIEHPPPDARVLDISTKTNYRIQKIGMWIFLFQQTEHIEGLEKSCKAD